MDDRDPTSKFLDAHGPALARFLELSNQRLEGEVKILGVRLELAQVELEQLREQREFWRDRAARPRKRRTTKRPAKKAAKKATKAKKAGR